MAVRVQEADFDPGAELDALVAGRTDVGAVASFTGLVRGGDVTEMVLEHWPGVTEKALAAIEDEARGRFELNASLIVHRYGPLAPGARIVFVAAAAPHRRAAFEAAEFMMDYLKTRAPFWKKEVTPDGASWVDAREADDAAEARWRD
ncbi:molybdenum cofactor biosynthesis protein MoaE [Roseobacter sp. HKCCA0434]|uniref:molybdenum cofactor biosynthesis protein MoaE n=1 Tax=Roseobacter sp. HKCCA0434 TaxID=3079297 RepID=UPI002905E656|nr:molybdenum cofactor biosynthesis protein MoaE [Roseobacter sp. HKCCA0434]